MLFLDPSVPPSNTPHSAMFVIVQDGDDANVTMTIPAVTLRAAAPAGSPIGDLLRRFVADKAEAQRIMQSFALNMPPDTDKLVGRLTIVGTRTDIAPPGVLSVSAEEVANEIALNLASTNPVNQWILYIDVLHSLTR